LGLVAGALLLAGCPLEEDDFDDDLQLNQKLIGSWTASGDGWSDTYIIKAGSPPKISHPSGDGGYMDYTDASIKHVYNFSDAAGCLIIERPDGKFSAVYFKDLTANNVLLGNAYDTNKVYDGNNPNGQDPATTTLEAAKERFKPENADAYGGGSAQGGDPQTREKD
jgi:hypothetical protein